ncbi:MAG: outer membrane protein transport protein [Bacteroidia bacterium]|nr:outer membrane protein transport protein [Bacteroidia bacterium]
MKNRLLLALLMLPFFGEGGGFQVNTQGQKATSMGGSVSGLAMDASVAFFNPGGLMALDSNYLNAGFAFLLPKSAFLGPYGGTEYMSAQLYTPFYVYANYRMKEKMALALSVNTPYGLGTKWKENWSGRYVSQEARLNTIFIQPTLAIRLSDKVSIGAGPVIVTGNARLSRALPVAGQDGSEGQVELKGAGNGFGFNAGLYAELAGSSIGLSYRSAVELDLRNGDATFSNIPDYLLNNGSFPSSSSFESSITLPAVLTLGIGHVFNEKISANLDFNYTGWEVYDSLIFEFPDQPQLDSRSPKKYKNSFALRLGGQYQYSARLQLRAGLAYDQSPVQDGYLGAELPDADKVIVAAGGSYRLKKGWSLEASFLFENLRERKEDNNVEHNLNGTYKSYLYVAGLGVQYQF